MPSSSSDYLRALGSGNSLGSTSNSYGGDFARSQYQSSDVANYQSAKLQMQHGSPKDRLPVNQSPLTRKSVESSQNYTNLLRSSLEQRSPSNSGQVTPPSSHDYNSSSLATSANFRKTLMEGDVGNRGDAGNSSSLADYSSYRKSLLAEYRSSVGAEPAAQKPLPGKDQKSNHVSMNKQSHSQTPVATETTNFSSPASHREEKHQPSNTTSLDKARRGSSLANDSKKSSSSQQLSVFNYEGGDRSSSRNHLHMLMNHNMMNAHQLSEDVGKKKSSTVKKSRRKITVNLQGTRYEVVREVVEKLGYTVTKDDDSSAYLLWNDTYVPTDRISEMKSFQRINHFPGMGEICRKDCLARNMAKMARAHPDQYDFAPKTWILPQEYNTLQNYYKDLKKKKKIKIFIAKPSTGAMGNGISLYHNAEKIPPSEQFVVQEYLERPFLIDGFKCDLRIYVLVSSCDPLKVFLFNDGLVRMGTEHYKDPSPQNLDVLFMHLTNYSINKHSETYEKGDSVSSGSKRSLQFLNDYMRRHDVDVANLWSNITDVIVKTMICALPHVHHAYKMCRPGQTPGSDSVCFEILGFDIMLDRKLKPWLLEVNRSPSFGTNEQIDYDIKSALLTDSLRIVNIRASDKKKNMAAQKAAAQRRLLQPRAGLNDTDDRRRTLQDKRKEELKELLVKIRRENAKTDYEDRNSGRFRRIFPPQDRFQQEKYAKLLLSAFSCLVSNVGGKTNSTMSREIERQYVTKYREDEVLDMLAQYESEDLPVDGRGRRLRGPVPLTGMPCSTSEPAVESDDSDSDFDDENEPEAPRPQRPSRTLSGRPHSSRPAQQRVQSAARSHHRSPAPGSRSMDSTNHLARRSLTEDTDAVNKALKEKEEELIGLLLGSLQEMRIKFPGKKDEEAEEILDNIMADWKFHKPRVASYWLVKLDSIKRRKVVDIVKSNIKAKVQHVYQTHDVDGLRIFRIFNRVFNRLLWSHGQGLWNCFSGNSWETIFSKSTDVITDIEMECCRRITELCKDCLLIVYQFANDAKNKNQPEAETARSEATERPNSSAPNHQAASQQTWKPARNVMMNRRYPKTYISAQPYKLVN